MNPSTHFARVIVTLRDPNFGIYIAGTSVSLIGTWMQRIAAGWLVWELSGSAAWLGVLAFLDLFPTMVIAPFAGVLSDRWERMRIMKVAQALGAIIAIALTMLYFAGYATLWVVLSATLLLGIVDAFVQPFRLALVPALVARKDLGSAVAIKSITFNLARFIGPAIAGIVIVSVGLGWAFAANAASFVALMIALHFVTARPQEKPPAGSSISVLGQAIEGFRYSLSAPGVGPVLLLLLASCFAGRPVIEMLPAWAGQVFGGTATDLAMLTSAVGVGAVIGGLWLAGRPNVQGMVAVYIVCSAGTVGALLAFSMAPTMLLALPIIALVGFFLISAAICAQTLVQLNVPDQMRGRVMSVYAIIIRGGPAFGALIMGLAGDVWGLRVPLVVAMAFLALAVGMVSIRRRQLASSLEFVA